MTLMQKEPSPCPLLGVKEQRTGIMCSRVPFRATEAANLRCQRTFRRHEAGEIKTVHPEPMLRTCY